MIQSIIVCFSCFFPSLCIYCIFFGMLCTYPVRCALVLEAVFSAIEGLFATLHILFD
ncbi:hypothetical protein QBC34DRAFT_397559 [Podospora aff. communis PSN243]|uniref:Uncharacterized protein n=1 Tax=Podospora aff. communis PSN243 TaxID=3040156 RepID=A0AAV9GX29_9PEZI|nr:hypothetical protein QBC34DRAFT_397559 [Podospora aff. communis PSN243]